MKSFINIDMLILKTYGITKVCNKSFIRYNMWSRNTPLYTPTPTPNSVSHAR